MAFLDKAGLERFWVHVVSLVGTKVEKEDGKGLSTEDFTTEEKEKLAGIAEGATNTVITNNVTSTSTTEALSAAQGKYLNDRISAITGSMEDLGGGDMMKATYDADNDGIVDKADHAFTADQDASGNVITSTYETKADANVKLDEAKAYADNAAIAVKNDLLNGAGTAYDTLKELGDLIDDNTDAIGALETVAASKADAEHTHAIADVTNLQLELDAKALASDITMKVYGNLSDIGLTSGATMDEVIAALPTNSVIYITSSSLTEDMIWWFPIGEGIIEIMKKDDQISATFYGGAGGEIWIARTMGHGMFTGSWDRLVREPELSGKQSTIIGGATTITNANLTANRALISDDNGKVAVSAVTSTELNYLDGVTSAIQTQLDTKALAADVTMKVYKNITDIGMTTASTFADVVAAVPMNAVIYIAAGALTDSSWSLPVTYGVIEIIRKGDTQVAIKLHGRVGRVWIAATTTAGVPTGEWNELIRESALNSELAKKLGNSGDQEIASGSLKITSTGDTALRLDKTIDDSNYVREYMILEADRARVGFGANGEIANQMSLYTDKTVFTQPVTIASGGTGASTAAGALTNLGITATAAELNKLDGVTATTAEINKLAGLKPTKAELDYVDGVTSNIQDQLNNKQDKITGAASSIVSSDFSNTDVVLISNSNGKVSSTSGVTTTQLKTLQGINSNIQNQLDAKVSTDGSIPMTDKLTINRATYPGVTLNEATVGSRGIIQNYGHSVVLDIFNVADNDTNRRSLMLRDNSVDTLATAVRLRDKNSTEDKYYDIYGEHNIEASMTELGYVKGVTSAIQTQLDGKQDAITGAISNVLNKDFTASRALVSQPSGKIGVSTTTSTELGYLSGVTSKVQDQLDGKVSTSGDTITGQLNMRHATMVQGTKPSSGLGRYVRYVDKDSNPLAYHGFYQGTSSSYFQIRAYNGLLTGTDKYAMFALGHNATNLPYCQVTSDSATFAASENGNVRNIQVQDASGANVATGKIIMKRK